MLHDLMSMRNVERVDFVKIDVEGYESDVLAEAVHTLRQYEALSVVEFNPFTLAVMAIQNPRYFLLKVQRTFPYMYAIDGMLNIGRPSTIRIPIPL